MLNIEYDFTELPKRNLDYFIPLNFQIDPEERELAIKTTGVWDHIRKNIDRLEI
jgi:hypothetical protein